MQRNTAFWRCDVCRNTTTVLEGEYDIFSRHFTLRLQIGALWIFCQGLELSPDKAALILGCDTRTVRTLWNHFRDYLYPIVTRMNYDLQIDAVPDAVTEDIQQFDGMKFFIVLFFYRFKFTFCGNIFVRFLLLFFMCQQKMS